MDAVSKPLESGSVLGQRNYVLLSLVFGVLFLGAFVLREDPLFIVFVGTVFNFFPHGFLYPIVIGFNPFILGLITGVLIKNKWLKIGVILGFVYSILLFLFVLKIWLIFGGDSVGKLFGAFSIEARFSQSIMVSLIYFFVFLAGYFSIKGLYKLADKRAKAIVIFVSIVYVAFNVGGGIVLLSYLNSMKHMPYEEFNGKKNTLGGEIIFDAHLTKDEALEIVKKYNGIDRTEPWNDWSVSHRMIVEFLDVDNDWGLVDLLDKIEDEEGVSAAFTY